jgi:hypothetical protein
MTDPLERQDELFDDDDQDILRTEDIGHVVDEDDQPGDEPMSEDEGDDPETAADIENQLTFEDDSIQGFFDHQGRLYFVALSHLYG